MKGKVKKYFSFRGYGFLEILDREEDIFFHVSNFPGNVLPIIGHNVEFDIIETQKGKEAVDILIVQNETKILEQDIDTQDKADVSLEDTRSNLDNLVGVGPKYQELLRTVGIDSEKKLAEENAASLFTKMKEINKKEKITKRLPTLENLEAWINLVQN
jgi:cold shock CspA family protein